MSFTVAEAEEGVHGGHRVVLSLRLLGFLVISRFPSSSSPFDFRSPFFYFIARFSSRSLAQPGGYEQVERLPSTKKIGQSRPAQADRHKPL